MKKIISIVALSSFIVATLAFSSNATGENIPIKVSGAKQKIVFSEDFESYSVNDNIVTKSNGRWTDVKSTWGKNYTAIEDPTGAGQGKVFTYNGAKESGAVQHNLDKGFYKIECKIYDPTKTTRNEIGHLYAFDGTSLKYCLGIDDFNKSTSGNTKYLYREGSLFNVSLIDRTQGWKTITIDSLNQNNGIFKIDDNEIAYSNPPVQINNIMIGTIWETATAGTSLVYFDDIKVYENIPYVSDLYPEISGQSIIANYQYNYNNVQNTEGTTKYQWLEGDTETATFTEIDGATSEEYTPSLSIGQTKWYKVSVVPVDKTGKEGMATISNPVSFTMESNNNLPTISDLKIIKNDGTDISKLYVGDSYEAIWSYSGNNDENNSEVQWQVSDTQNGSYMSVVNGNSFTPDTTYMNKFIRVKVKPKDTLGNLGIAYYTEGYKVEIKAFLMLNGTSDKETTKAILLSFLEDKDVAYAKLPLFEKDKLAYMIIAKKPYTDDTSLLNIYKKYENEVIKGLDGGRYNELAYQDFEDDAKDWELIAGTKVINNIYALKGTSGVEISGSPSFRLKYSLGKRIYPKYSFYFYDNVDVSTYQFSIMIDGDSKILMCADGTAGKTTKYYCRINNVFYSTQAGRSTGWHKGEIDFTSEKGVHIYVDGELIYNGENDTANQQNDWLYKSESIVIGNTWGNTLFDNKIGFDTLTVTEKSKPFAENLVIQQNQKTLTAVYDINNVWGNDLNDMTKSYQWYYSETQDGTYTKIEGAIEQTYSLKPLDIGKYFKVDVVFSIGETSSTKAQSEPFKETFFASFSPIVSNVSIDGTVSLGSLIKVSYYATKGLYELEPNNNKYYWSVSDTADGEFTTVSESKEFALPIKDIGKFVKVRVYAGDIEGNLSPWAESVPKKDTTSLTEALVAISKASNVTKVDIQKIFKKLSAEFNQLTEPQQQAVVNKVVQNVIVTIDDFEELVEDIVKPNTPSYSLNRNDSSGKIISLPSVPPVVIEDTPDEGKQINVNFKDMQGYDWAQEAINNLAKNKIMIGKSIDTFEPYANITREEFIAVLIRLFGWNDDSAVSKFKDVDSSAWYYSYIATAEKLNVIRGVSAENFGIGQDISRQDMATLAYRFIEKSGLYISINADKTVFADQDKIAAYSELAVDRLVRAKILNGIGEGKFEPQSSANRAMSAQLINQLYNKIK